MSKKDELKGGLSALFGDTAEPHHEQTSTDEAVKAKEMEVEQTTRQDEEDLINSTEDEELRELLKARRMDGRGRPRKDCKDRESKTQGYSRTSLILNDAQVAKIKEIGFRETLTMKELFELALNMVIEKYEQTHGEVVPRPERYKGDINSIFNNKK